MEPKLIVVVGETASGKSTLAMELAQKFNGELICADSWTVYKGFDIGTAKPSVKERYLVRHHLLDIADPGNGFSAAEFKRYALEAIDDISSREKLAIMVGGTGLYVDSVVFDYSFLPAASVNERQKFNALTIEKLLDELAKRNISVEGIDIRNKRRLIRLLEANGQRPTKHALRDNTLVLGLRFDKTELERRIVARVDEMLRAGLENEVRDLAKRYGWDVEPMKGIGYREFKDYFEGKSNLEEVRERIIKNTNDLAKKQRTWFKRNNSIQWVSDPSHALKIVSKFLNT